MSPKERLAGSFTTTLHQSPHVIPGAREIQREEDNDSSDHLEILRGLGREMSMALRYLESQTDSYDRVQSELSSIPRHSKNPVGLVTTTSSLA